MLAARTLHTATFSSKFLDLRASLWLKVFEARLNFATIPNCYSTNTMSPRSAGRTRRILKLLHLNFLLRTTMPECFLHLRKFLGGQSCKLFRAGLTRRQQCRDEASSFLSDDITMRLGHFCDQSMSPQQSQPTSHRRHLTTLFFFVAGRQGRDGNADHDCETH